MKLRLLKPYGMLAVGDAMDVRETIGSLLIGRGVAEEIKERAQGNMAQELMQRTLSTARQAKKK